MGFDGWPGEAQRSQRYSQWVVTESGRMTHGCMRASYTEKVGGGGVDTPAKAPAAMTTSSGSPSRVQYTVDPHTGQKWSVTTPSAFRS